MKEYEQNTRQRDLFYELDGYLHLQTVYIDDSTEEFGYTLTLSTHLQQRLKQFQNEKRTKITIKFDPNIWDLYSAGIDPYDEKTLPPSTNSSRGYPNLKSKRAIRGQQTGRQVQRTFNRARKSNR